MKTLTFLLCLSVASVVLAGNAGAQSAMRGQRPAYCGPALGFVSTPVYDRYALVPGTQVVGPAIIEERESTALIPPGMVGRLDRHLNLLIRTTI